MIFIDDLENIYEYDNVILVNEILSQEAFDELFPHRYHTLEYKHFLTAVA